MLPFGTKWGGWFRKNRNTGEENTGGFSEKWVISILEPRWKCKPRGRYDPGTFRTNIWLHRQSQVFLCVDFPESQNHDLLRTSVIHAPKDAFEDLRAATSKEGG